MRQRAPTASMPPRCRPRWLRETPISAPRALVRCSSPRRTPAKRFTSRSSARPSAQVPARRASSLLEMRQSRRRRPPRRPGMKRSMPKTMRSRLQRGPPPTRPMPRLRGRGRRPLGPRRRRRRALPRRRKREPRAAQTDAETARTGAQTAETNAETAQTEAESAQTAAEAAVAGAETALASSGAALAFNDLWAGDIDITTASQWKALGTEAVPSNATWIIWNGGKASADDNDGPAALSTWINAAAWRVLAADTVDTTPGDGTGMLMVDWVSTNIGDGSPDFARRDAIIGRTSADIPLIHEHQYQRRFLRRDPQVHHAGGGDAWRWCGAADRNRRLMRELIAHDRSGRRRMLADLANVAHRAGRISLTRYGMPAARP